MQIVTYKNWTIVISVVKKFIGLPNLIVTREMKSSKILSGKLEFVFFAERFRLFPEITPNGIKTGLVASAAAAPIKATPASAFKATA